MMDKEMPSSMDNLGIKELIASDSLTTLKSIESEMYLEKMIFMKEMQEEVKLMLSSGAHEENENENELLIETGSINNTTQENDDIIGDCKQSEKTGESVQETVDEYGEHLILDIKYANLMSILMEKGREKFSENDSEQKNNENDVDSQKNSEIVTEPLTEEEQVLQLILDTKPANLSEVLTEKGCLESWINDSQVEDPLETLKINEETIIRDIEATPTDMTRIINDINRCTAHLETDPEQIDWEGFRLNLLKIHQYYMNKKENTQPEVKILNDLSHVETGIDEMMEPLNSLIVRSKSLSNNIEGIEKKISSLDLKMEEFYDKYNKTLVNREKAFNDMITLQSMREKIGQRLTQIEMEIHASKTRLFQQGVQNK